MASKIRITDLGSPELSPLQTAAIEHCEQLAIDMSSGSILGEACERTGFEDFGSMDFVTRLDMWLDEVGNDPDRRNVGRLSLRNACVRYASNRLLINDLLTRHPEIHDIEIHRPIVIVGLPRTGTTNLVNLLSADDSMRSMPLWESYEPVPRRGEGPGADGLDPRYQRCLREWDAMQMMSPLVQYMHPMNPDHVHEELELMLPDFSSYNLEWIARVPRWRDYYVAQDQTPHYEYMKTALKVLTWFRPRARWILKSPQHLEQLGPLMKVFPDACVVMTHRDPVAVVQSAATMTCYAARMSYRTIDPGWYADYWTDRVGTLLSAAVRDVDCVPNGQRFDCHFKDFVTDELSMVRAIFEWAGHPLTERAAKAVTGRIEHRAQHPEPTIAYNIRADFGRTPEEVRAGFGSYMERFDVPIDVT